MEKPLIVSHLSKSYGSIQAVKAVSFEIEPNEIFALIGPNGAGKSTVLKIVSTLLTPSVGDVKVFGLDVVKKASDIRPLISYLPEEAGAYKNMTGQNYLRFMADIFTKDKMEAKKFVETGTLVSGLGNRLKDKIGTYSKGMVRKILLAKTLMVNPRLAILDEPTSGLDVINALEIRSQIREHAKKGMAVLLSSHNMLEIEFLSDRVGIIDQGVLQEIGTPPELKTKYQTENLEEVFRKLTGSSRR